MNENWKKKTNKKIETNKQNEQKQGKNETKTKKKNLKNYMLYVREAIKKMKSVAVQ